jgi:putative transposase
MRSVQRKPNRLKEYDYSTAGYYFVTICAKDRICWLGEVVDEKMLLNNLGKIVQNCWLDLPNHYKNIALDEYIVMPNHFHGILIIQPVGDGFKPSPTRMHGMSEIIRGFKTFSSRKINDLKQIHFHWQRSFYDNIIRTDESLNKIREYIKNNPKQWLRDELN